MGYFFARSLLMMILATSVATSVVTSVARADLAKNAELDIVCIEQGVAHPKVIQIFSGSNGSTVTLDGKKYLDRQLVGGTEGGDPYLQAVNNAGGYNITIAGGDFQKAFEGLPVASGTATASVDLFLVGQRFGADCTGSFGFTPMRSALPPIVAPAAPAP